MKLSKDFMRFFTIPIVFFLGVLITAGFTTFYTTTCKSPSGKIVDTNWPKKFTLAFSSNILFENDIPTVTEDGEQMLKDNDLWLQIIDTAGKEVLSYDTPADTPTSYQAYELLQLFQYGTDRSSVFISTLHHDSVTYSYLIGFPLSISKVTMYVDNSRYNSGKILIILTLVLTVLLILTLTIFYNVTISKSYEGIRTSLRAVASKTYEPVKKQHFLTQIYDGINLLDQDIEAANNQREQDEKAKEEWLANITHDLKTPLAPIRGYAELLSDSTVSCDAETTVKYGKIILKNTLYAEQLVNDLKLTYQLQSNMFPLKKESIHLSRFVKEIIIDLLNTPDYEDHLVSFESDHTDPVLDCDPQLFRRALINVIANALKHNSSETQITVTISEDTDSDVITVADNGHGMSAQELHGLFKRYYRGTNTEAKPEGSGLGMAIARQIIQAHNGRIDADSTLGSGTTITIYLPKAN